MRRKKSQSLLFRSAVWFGATVFWLAISCKYVAIPSIQVCCLIQITMLVGKVTFSLVAIPSIQVCCLIQMKFYRLRKNTWKSQSLLFRSAVWFEYSDWLLFEKAKMSQSLLFRSAVWFAIIIGLSQDHSIVAIPSIQVCCLIPYLVKKFWKNKIRYSRNPFYSGLLFDSNDRTRTWDLLQRSRNPFYSGLLFDSEAQESIADFRRVWSQSLLFRSAVWFKKQKYASTIKKQKVAIPSIQVCCLIQNIGNLPEFYTNKSRNPFYSGLLFDSKD